MPRTTYVYDEKLGKMVLKENYVQERGVLVVGDLPDILSPIDGKIIHGRAGLREHNRQHNVTHPSDFTNEWKKKAIDRHEFLNGNASSKARKGQVAEAYQRVREGYKPRSIKEGES